MTLSDVVKEWDTIGHQKKRQALQAIINYIDYEDDTWDDLARDIIEFVQINYEQDDYFGTEGLRV